MATSTTGKLFANFPLVVVGLLFLIVGAVGLDVGVKRLKNIAGLE